MEFKIGDLVRTNSKMGRYAFEKWQKGEDNYAYPYWRRSVLWMNLETDVGVVMDVSSNGMCSVQFIRSGNTLIFKSRWLKKAKK